MKLLQVIFFLSIIISGCRSSKEATRCSTNSQTIFGITNFQLADTLFFFPTVLPDTSPILYHHDNQLIESLTPPKMIVRHANATVSSISQVKDTTAEQSQKITNKGMTNPVSNFGETIFGIIGIIACLVIFWLIIKVQP